MLNLKCLCVDFPQSGARNLALLKAAIEPAREQVAELIGARATEVIFTSCATESNNAAIAAALKANPAKRHIVTSKVEHSSVLNYCMALEQENCSEPSFPPQPSFPRRRESTASSCPEERNMDPRFRGG